MIVPPTSPLAHSPGMVSTQEAVFRASIAANVPVFMKGDSGIGKNAFIRDYATASHRHLESVVLAHKEKFDIGGIPTVHEGPVTTTEFAVPGWGHRLVEADKGLLLLSEFNMGEVDVQQASMNVLQERQVGENTTCPTRWRSCWTATRPSATPPPATCRARSRTGSCTWTGNWTGSPGWTA